MDKNAWNEYNTLNNEGSIYHEEPDNNGNSPPGVIFITKEGQIVNMKGVTKLREDWDSVWDMWEVNETRREFIKFDTIQNKSTIRFNTISEVLNFYKQNKQKGGKKPKYKLTKKKTKRSRKSRVKRA